MITNNETPVIYYLESMDSTNKTGVLKLKEAKPRSHWVKLKVTISPLLAYKIKNKDHRGLMLNDTFLKTEFKSTLKSPNYYENPFRLVEFVPNEHSDIPLNYRLELVTEMQSEKIEKPNAFHRKVIIGYKNRFLKPEQYLRFIQLTVKRKQSECKRKLSFLNNK